MNPGKSLQIWASNPAKWFSTPFSNDGLTHDKSLSNINHWLLIHWPIIQNELQKKAASLGAAFSIYPEYRSHLIISRIVAFFPYIKIPTRYILPVSHIKNHTVSNIIPNESTICHQGGSNARRAGIMIGENSGNNDEKTARLPFGFDKTGNNI